MQSQCEFLTKNERTIIDLLKESPKQYTEIIDFLKKEWKPKKESSIKRTANNLLNRMEEKREIFRIEIDGKVFYKLNIFPAKIQHFFRLVDYLNQAKLNPGYPRDDAWKILLEIKDEVLRNYPAIPFEKILKRHREYISFAKPKLKGIIQILKEHEGNMHEHPFG